jgi:hypothetical protein
LMQVQTVWGLEWAVDQFASLKKVNWSYCSAFGNSSFFCPQ